MTAGLGCLQTAAFLPRIGGDVTAHGFTSHFRQCTRSIENITPAALIGGASGTCKQRGVAQRSTSSEPGRMMTVTQRGKITVSVPGERELFIVRTAAARVVATCHYVVINFTTAYCYYYYDHYCCYCDTQVMSRCTFQLFCITE